MAWKLDKVHSSVGFSIKHLVISTARGKFTDFDATLSLNESDLTLSSVSAIIKAASIDTGDAGRDGHVRSADFFDADEEDETADEADEEETDEAEDEVEEFDFFSDEEDEEDEEDDEEDFDEDSEEGKDGSAEAA